jgi:hypothetical protein
MTYGTANIDAIATSSGQILGAGNSTAFKNRIINGGMVIDQRNAGTSYTQVNGLYNLDRWDGNSYNGGAATNKFSVIQSTTAPTGFQTSLLVTSLSASSTTTSDIYNIEQKIEGYNFADFLYGTSNSKTLTLSFWVQSSITGTFGGALKNSARNRAYPFTYTISSANTWQYITLTIPGDTTGTWVGATNGIGLWVSFGLGVGSSFSGTAGAWTTGDLFSATGASYIISTNSATWYITGVQLEVGSTATAFDYRPYGTELALCQRYFQTTYPSGTPLGSTSPTYTLAIETISQATTSYLPIGWNMPVVMRTTPTATLYNPNTGSSSASNNIYLTSGSNLPSTSANVSQNAVLFYVNNSSVAATAAIEAHFGVSAEL